MFTLYLSPFLPCFLSFGNSLVVVIQRALKYTSGKGSSKSLSACHAEFTYFLNTSYWSSRSRAVWCHHLHVHFIKLYTHTYSILTQHIVPQSCVCTKKSDRLSYYDAIVSTKIMWWALTGPLACHVPSNTPGLSAWRPSSFNQEYFASLMSRSAVEEPLAMVRETRSFRRRTVQLGRRGRNNLPESMAGPARRSDDERLGTFVCGVLHVTTMKGVCSRS